MVQWANLCFPSWGTQVQSPREILMWNLDSPVSVVSLHWWPRRDWSLWPRLRRAESQTVTRPLCQQCDNPTWSHTALCPGFTLAAGPPSGFTTDIVGCWVGALWRACNLTTFIHSLTGPVGQPFASPHDGPGFNPGGYLFETGILLLALSRYNRVINSFHNDVANYLLHLDVAT